MSVQPKSRTAKESKKDISARADAERFKKLELLFL